MFFGVFQFFTWIISNILGRIFLNLKVEGTENLKKLKPGGVLFVSNHEGSFDPFLIGAAIPQWYYRQIKCFRYLTYYKYIRHKWYGFFIWLSGAYSVFPGRGPLEEILAKTIKLLKDGQDVLIFPTAKRKKEFKPEDARPGVAYVAKKTGATIVPVYIQGTYKINFLDIILRKRKVRIIFGTPFCRICPDNDGKGYSAMAKKILEQINILFKTDKDN